MTNEEAIEVFKNDIEICTIQQKQACDMAIKALEQTELNSSYNSVKTELKPCEDCISRQAVLDEKCTHTYPDGFVEEYVTVKDILELPSVMPQQPRWILCSESLPKTTGAFLVTCANSNVKVGHFSTVYGWSDAKAIAWMPLPEGYKNDDEVNK